MRLTKQEQHQLVEAVQRSAESIEVQMMLRLLRARFEDARNALVGVSAADFPCAQGEARAYEKLLTLLARPSIPSSTKE